MTDPDIPGDPTDPNEGNPSAGNAGSVDREMRRLLDEVASDVSDVTDAEALAGLHTAIGAAGPARSLRSKTGLVILSAAAALAMVFGAVAVLGGDDDPVDVAIGGDLATTTTFGPSTSAPFLDDCGVDDPPPPSVPGPTVTTEPGTRPSVPGPTVVTTESSNTTESAHGDVQLLRAGASTTTTDTTVPPTTGTRVFPPDTTATTAPAVPPSTQPTSGPQTTFPATTIPGTAPDTTFPQTTVPAQTTVPVDTTTTTCAPEPEPGPSTTGPAATTPDPDAGDPGPVLVVVDRQIGGEDFEPVEGTRVSVYFDDGIDPIFFEPGFGVVHAELDRSSRTFWLTVGGAATGTPSQLVHVDPESGQELERIEGAGYAALSPDGDTLAYSIESTYGGTDQAVVLRDLLSGDERTIEGDSRPVDAGRSVVGSFRHLDWSPDGTRLLVNEAWEDDIIWLINIDVEEVREGVALGIAGADWLSNDRLIATAYCCYADPDQEPRHLAEVDLGGAEPRVIDLPDLASFERPFTAAPGDGVASFVHIDADGRLVRQADGTVISQDPIDVQW